MVRLKWAPFFFFFFLDSLFCHHEWQIQSSKAIGKLLSSWKCQSDNTTSYEAALPGVSTFESGLLGKKIIQEGGQRKRQKDLFHSHDCSFGFSRMERLLLLSLVIMTIEQLSNTY